MRPWSSPIVVPMMEGPFFVSIDPRSSGGLGHKRELMEEVARIEKDWGLL